MTPESNSTPIPKSRLRNKKTRAVSNLDKRIRHKRKKITSHKTLAYQNQRKLEKLETAKRVEEGKQTLVTQDQIDEEFKEIFSREKVWEGTPLQYDFLAANEDEVLFSGGRGSGKSDALLIDALRDCGNKNFRGLVLRRTMPELSELIGRAQEYYPKVFPGCRWHEQKRIFRFPSGAIIEFGYCDSMEDLLRYQGRQFTWIGIDEITQYDSDDIINKLKASNRNPDKTLKKYIRATTNPSGPGRNWVKERWVDKGQPNTKIIVPVIDKYGNELGQITRRWFHSTVKDNKYLMEGDPNYIVSLASLEGALGEQWYHGSWDSADGLAFADFKRGIHVVDPFPIPSNWYKFRCCDWGFATMAVCLWIAVDYDGNLWVYRELKTGGSTTNAPDFAELVKAAEAGERIQYGVLDSSTWANRGEVGPSIAEQMIQVGCRWQPSDRSPGSRVSGKLLLHRLLQINPVTQQPKIKFFSNCLETIKELSSLQLDDLNPEDIDRNAVDHAWDALRYGIASRPINFGTFNDIFSSRTTQAPVIVDTTFGY